MRAAVLAAATVDEAKDISDKAAALKAYASQHRDPALYRKLAEIQLRAKRRIGELSVDLDTAQGTRTELRSIVGTKSKREALAAAGISRTEADRCEQLQQVPAEIFESYLAEKEAAGDEVIAREVCRSSPRPDWACNRKVARLQAHPDRLDADFGGGVTK